MNSVSTIQGNILNTLGLSGGISAYSDLTGIIQSVKGLTGAIDAQSNIAGNFNLIVFLSGNIAVVSNARERIVNIITFDLQSNISTVIEMSGDIQDAINLISVIQTESSYVSAIINSVNIQSGIEAVINL